MTTLTQKKVLITGASRGIGRVTAQIIAKENAIVVGVARSQSGLDALCRTIKEHGGMAYGIVWDLSDINSLSELIRRIESEIGAIDILINNAGIEIYRAFQDYSTADLQAVLSVNLLAAMELTRLILPGMIHQGTGHIVNIASAAAKKGHPFDSAYSASKAGLLMWGDALRQELVGTHVYVSAICPGYVEQCGMLVDTGIPAPKLAGTSTPDAVAAAVVRAIQHNQAEVLLNKDAIATNASKILFTLCQLFPRWGDAVYRLIGVPSLNRLRIKQHLNSQPEVVIPQLTKD